jgi:hypothetical protein
MTRAKLSEETVKALAVPASGNRVTYFISDVLQGVTVPRGFGVRVTSSGARAFVLNYRIRHREYRFTIGAYPDWSALKAVHAACASASTEATIRSMTASRCLRR